MQVPSQNRLPNVRSQCKLQGPSVKKQERGASIKGTKTESFFSFSPSAVSQDDSTFCLLLNAMGVGRVHTFTGTQEPTPQPGVCVHCPLAARVLGEQDRELASPFPTGLPSQPVVDR